MTVQTAAKPFAPVAASAEAPVLIAGGGIGGMAAALSLARQGVEVHLFEQAPELSEVGAGIQLGPNAVRVLEDWGLGDALRAVAAFPEALQVRDSAGGGMLGVLPLGERTRRLYRQPYACIHRVDLLALLTEAVAGWREATLHLGQRITGYELTGSGGVCVHTQHEERCREGAALVGADGLWSAVRGQMLGKAPPRFSGHLAYRGTVPAAALPERLRAPRVTAWFGERLHVVHYPVRSGNVFNVVAVIEGELGKGHGLEPDGDPRNWSHEARAVDLLRALKPAHKDLLDVIDAVQHWQLWALHDRAPVASAAEHAEGPVALLGDAAHPLRPYLAQGAAMALEDAWTLGRMVHTGAKTPDWPVLMKAYAQTRWARNARVQARSARNGTIFHAGGLLRWGRNLAMSALGEKLMDVPWLYQGPPEPRRIAH
ncbi:FAD-dependent monooxygenase [Hydrogenophaga sp. 5NK40-0174]|uniref:FAD-dependent monooxygenase n=1 Tax=Hydrogenophaga sp. 5NK40-0174 TaxID=3127649 RepID=UPI00310395B3